MKARALASFFFLAAVLGAAPCRAAGDLWPDLSKTPPATGGGEKDAAVIIGAENYAFVAKVPGARKNAEDWQAYLTETLKVPSDRVVLLRDNEATLEKMRRFAAQAASQVEDGGTLWFVFIGHGAPSKDGKDGLLVGSDAQQDADGLFARSLPRNELLAALSKGKQARTMVLIDACFSGRSPSGETLVAGLQPLVLVNNSLLASDPRTVLMTAARSDQFAGPLPKAAQMRPAFSYLALGALRGWAADADGKVMAAAVIDFARKALALDHGRTQTPELASGAAGLVLGVGRESPPDLSRIDREEIRTAPPPEAPAPKEPAARPAPKPQRVAGEFPAELNLEELRAAALDYRRKAGLLRKHIDFGERGLSAAEADANAAARLARIRTPSAQPFADPAAFAFGLFNRGSASLGDIEVQRTDNSAPLRDQAKNLEGEKKRMALKADQYEQLADSMYFLISAETLRKQAEEAARSAGDKTKAVSGSKELIQTMDLW
jgi:uncharacterized caspase-like protein